MSDLAPFVAAVLRDKVVAELQQEVQALREQLQQEREFSQAVEITGPRGNPVYARAAFREGNYDYSPELWKVEFRQDHDLVPCTVSELGTMEVRIGGVCKARLANGTAEGFVNDVNNNYNHVEKSGVVSIWFGGSAGIWVGVQVQPMERSQYASLRDFDLGGDGLVETLLRFVEPQATVTFTESSFLIGYVNGAMERWGLKSEAEF